MIVLASASPRRKELLARAGFAFEIDVAEADETRFPGEPIAELPGRLALLKAKTVVVRRPNDLVIAADTVVSVGDDELGKPRNADEHRAFLERLSGAWHHVRTGVAIVEGDREAVFVDTTAVRFRPLSASEMDAYIRHGDGGDKAGGYAVQGGAMGFPDRVRGSLTNVVGLPVERLTGLLKTWQKVPR